MLIEYKRERHMILEFKAKKKCDLTESINEAGHIFDKQYDIADLLAGMVTEALFMGKNSINVDLTRYGTHLRNVKVNIEKNNLVPGVKASLTKLTTDGDAVLDVFVYMYYKMMDNTKEEIKNSAERAIAHELNHTKFGFSRGVKNVDPFPVPEYYEDVTTALKRDDVQDYGNLTYTLLYCLYNINDVETPAFVSQCYGEVLAILRKCKVLNNNTFRYAIRRSETYENYHILRDYLDEMFYLTNQQKETEISNLNEIVPSIKIKTIIEYNKVILKLKQQVEKAIHDCERCATEAFYDAKGK